MHKSTVTLMVGAIFCTLIQLGSLLCKQSYASDNADVSIRELATQAKRKQIKKELMDARPVPGNGELVEREPVYLNPLVPFMTDLQKRIFQRWRPVKGHEKDRTVLEFKVFKNGEVMDVKVVHPSGSVEVDEAAIHAVKSAAPFLRVPNDGVHREFYEIQFTFPPPPPGANLRHF